MQFSIFDGICGFHHALTTRADGVSNGEFSSLNLAFHVGDKPEKVRENRRILAQKVGFDATKLTCAQQVHGDAIQIVGPNEIGRGALSWDDALPACDALLTGEIGAPLLILVADCAPLLLVDEENRAFAVVHAGWRGAVAGIAGKSVLAMQNAFGTRPENLKIGVGPCLNVENLEIGPEVAEIVEKVDSQAIIGGFSKPHLDLRGLLRRNLEHFGVLKTHIEIINQCPMDDNLKFFSHRGQKGCAGRFGIVGFFE